MAPSHKKSGTDGENKVKGRVVLMSKNALEPKDIDSTAVDQITDFLGQKVELRLVSATAGEPAKGSRGLVGPAAYLEPERPSVSQAVGAGETPFSVTFTVVNSHGTPGAVIIKNHSGAPFYLKSIAIDSFPGKGRIYFDCNSWVYDAGKYTYDRIFFANDTYLPKNTPEPLRAYRQDELRNIRGDDVNRKMEEWDRVYNYDFYNDLGNPDSSPTLARPVLGGSAAFPYPRRCKTGRPPSKTDPKTESQTDLEIYVPRDERIGHTKKTDFLDLAIKMVAKDLLPVLKPVMSSTANEFDSFSEVLDLYTASKVSL